MRYDIDEEVRKKIVEMVDAGEHLNDVSLATGIPVDVLDKKLAEWVCDDESSRFNVVKRTVFRPTDKMAALLPIAMEKLENRDVEGFLGDVAPIAAAQMAHDSVNAKDERVRHMAQKDILDRAGFKPKTQIEIYQKYDKMTHDELIGSIRGMLMTKPELVRVLADKLSDASSKVPELAEKNEVIDVDVEEVNG